ncbi:MAG: PHP domain-containing protein [Archaeoglobaceae archaeon]
MMDYHIHSNYSDGKASVLEIAKKAKELRLREIAIVDHSIELSFGLDERKAKKRAEEIEIAKETYGIKIYSGIECGVNGFGEIYLPDFDFDLIVVSVHECALNYFDRIIKCIEKNNVQVVGHVLSELFGHSRDAEKENKLLDELESIGVALELNSGHRCPPEDFLAKCSERDLIISIGSDAHKLEKVGNVGWSLEKLKKYFWRAKLLRI